MSYNCPVCHVIVMYVNCKKEKMLEKESKNQKNQYRMHNTENFVHLIRKIRMPSCT